MQTNFWIDNFILLSTKDMCTSIGSDTVSNSSIRLYFIAPFSSHFLFFSKTGSPLLPVLSTDPGLPVRASPSPSLGSGLPWESRIDVTKGFRAGPEGQRWNQGQRHGFAPSIHARSCAAPPRPQFLFRHGFSAATSSLNTAKLLPGERERGKKKIEPATANPRTLRRKGDWLTPPAQPMGELLAPYVTELTPPYPSFLDSELSSRSNKWSARCDTSQLFRLGRHFLAWPNGPANPSAHRERLRLHQSEAADSDPLPQLGPIQAPAPSPPVRPRGALSPPSLCVSRRRRPPRERTGSARSAAAQSGPLPPEDSGRRSRRRKGAAGASPWGRHGDRSERYAAG